MLWLYDENWSVTLHSVVTIVSMCSLLRPELLHPFASAIDSPELEAPDDMVGVVRCARNLTVFTNSNRSL